MNNSWLSVALGFVLLSTPAPEAAGRELAGLWSCPATLQLALLGRSELSLQLNTRSRLHQEGRYESDGDAVVHFGVWPLTLGATSRGQWRRDQQQMTVTVEALELSPGSASGVELQRVLIQQLTALFPELPHTHTTRILAETPAQLTLEDESGQRYTCSRL